MTNKKHALTSSEKATITIKLEPKVHAYLSLLAEQYGTTLSGTIYKLISDHEPDIIQLYEEIEALKQRRMSGS